MSEYEKSAQPGQNDSLRQRQYIAIDLKSFYASVECVVRGMNPLTTNLVVADESRTEKTICLAVSPSLKEYGIPGRARLFEVVQKIRNVNEQRRAGIIDRKFTGKSYNSTELHEDSTLEVSYIVAPPQMAKYMDVSNEIYNIYLKYIAPEDIHVYSVDEVFIDATDYLNTYRMTAHELAIKMIKDVLETTGITATAGIGTNLYLCKVAMDIVAKHMPADKAGVRIASLDERKYRELLWTHEPITDFWRVGRGYAKKLQEHGMYTMGDVARCSIGAENNFYNEDLLYKLFGVNAELLIDHAWGFEPCLISQIKEYKPSTNSISSGQVLRCPYEYDKAQVIVREMTELLVLDLVDKCLVTDQIVLTVGYDIENLTDPDRARAYKGPVTTDNYGRRVPKHAHGTFNLNGYTSSSKIIVDSMMNLYQEIVNYRLLVRRINVTANHVINENKAVEKTSYEQMSLFVDYEAEERIKRQEKEEQKKERCLQEAVISIKKKYGKNAILKGTSFQEGATTIERNNQIGGHKA